MVLVNRNIFHLSTPYESGASNKYAHVSLNYVRYSDQVAKISVYITFYGTQVTESKEIDVSYCVPGAVCSIDTDLEITYVPLSRSVRIVNVVKLSNTTYRVTLEPSQTIVVVVVGQETESVVIKDVIRNSVVAYLSPKTVSSEYQGIDAVVVSYEAGYNIVEIDATNASTCLLFFVSVEDLADSYIYLNIAIDEYLSNGQKRSYSIGVSALSANLIASLGQATLIEIYFGG